MARNIVNFVRGLDLSGSDFSADDSFPKDVVEYKNLQWLRLNQTGIDVVPAVLTRLEALEHISLEHNKLIHLPHSMGLMSNLRAFHCGWNNLTQDDIPKGLFRGKDLSTVDLSHNRLSSVPDAIEHADGLLVLHLGGNDLKSAPATPLLPTLFVNCLELRYLDLSCNSLQELPQAFEKLVNLSSLRLASNPLHNTSLQPLLALVKLETLDLKATGLNAQSFHATFGKTFLALRDLNLAENLLSEVPVCLQLITSLERLNLSDNDIKLLPLTFDSWAKLETLNISRNSLTSLPDGISALKCLRMLFASMNTLVQLPDTIGDLTTLSQVKLSENYLTCVPPSLFTGCDKLVVLKLDGNNLKTLPRDLHKLSHLRVLTVHNNDGFVMPPRFPPSPPPSQQPPPHPRVYGVDFTSVCTEMKEIEEQNCRDQLGLKTRETAAKTSGASPQKLNNKDESGGQIILEGLVQAATRQSIAFARKSKDTTLTLGADDDDETNALAMAMGEFANPRKTKMFQSSMFDESLDYSDVFGGSLGESTGIVTFRIEQFVPVRIENFNGVFASGDSYILLYTQAVPQHKGDYDTIHEIFYWIGSEASLDKNASAAINAVQLRNFLRVRATIMREEQGNESHRFKQLYGGAVITVAGGTDSGFYHTSEPDHIDRLYVLNGWSSVRADAVPVAMNMLQSDRVLLLDTNDTLYLWRGSQTPYLQYHRYRLFAENALRSPTCEGQKLERIVDVEQGDEQKYPKFFSKFANETTVEYSIPTSACRVFEIKLGHGFLELPQVGKCADDRTRSRRCLNSKGTYIIDAHADMFVWTGQKASRLVQAAATRLMTEIKLSVQRPPHFLVTFLTEGTESVIFSSKFFDWEADTIAKLLPSPSPPTIDTSVARWNVDAFDLFRSKKPIAMEEAKSVELVTQWSADLEKCDAYVLQSRNFVRLEQSNFGTFCSENCYVFLCKEWHVIGTAQGGDDGELEELECTAYFWQGRDAGMMGWLIFCHSFLPAMQELVLTNLECKLSVAREYQQNESMRFLALFDQQMIVVKGHASDTALTTIPKLFHLHCWGPTIFTRTVEVPCMSTSLNSYGCFVLRVPTHTASGLDKPTAYVWFGSRVSEHDIAADSIIAQMTILEGFDIVTIQEGAEPESFWNLLDEKSNRSFDKEFHGLDDTRFFNCGFVNGELAVKEKFVQFSQDSLDDHSVSIVTTSTIAYVWCGRLSTPALQQMSGAAANEYVRRSTCNDDNNNDDDGDDDDDDDSMMVVIVTPGCEPHAFTKCFHGWGRVINRSLELTRSIPKLKHILDPLPQRPPAHLRHDKSPFYIHLRPTVQGKPEPVLSLPLPLHLNTSVSPTSPHVEHGVDSSVSKPVSPVSISHNDNDNNNDNNINNTTTTMGVGSAMVLTPPTSKLSGSARKSSSRARRRSRSSESILATAKPSLGSLFSDNNVVDCPNEDDEDQEAKAQAREKQRQHQKQRLLQQRQRSHERQQQQLANGVVPKRKAYKISVVL